MQAELAGLAVHQGDHDGPKGLLHLGMLVQVVEHHVGVHIALELDDDAHAGAVGLVADIRDAVQPLFMHQLRDLFHQPGLVDHVGDFGDHDALAVLGHGLDFGARPGDDAAAAGLVGLVNAGLAQDNAPGGEIRALDDLHQILAGAVRVVDQVDDPVDGLAQVVGRDVGGHAHRDAVGAVDQQIGEPAGHDLGLGQGLVKVGIKVYGFLVDIPHHFHGELRKPGLGVPHGRGAVAVHRAKVALALHQQVAGGEILGQAHHGVVHRGVAVGVIFTQHIAHDTRRLAEGLIRGHAQLVHGVQNAPVHRL